VLNTLPGVEQMQGANKERWRVLCEQAAVEQDPKRLLELTRQINDLLLGKQHRLDGEGSPDNPKD
jgi:hypothetical protein